MNRNKSRKQSVQALRAVLFTMVFISHLGIAEPVGKFAVSAFFVLSGFLTNSYFEKEMSLSAAESVRYAWGKIKKLYPVYLATLLAMAVYNYWINAYFEIVPEDFFEKTAVEFLVNALLLQTWLVRYSYCLNPPAWFLATAFFIYIAFPYVLDAVKRIDGGRIKQAMAAVVAMQAAASILAVRLSPDNDLAYVLPVIRLGDFTVGCLLGRLYKAGGLSLDRMPAAAATLLEAGAFITAFVAVRLADEGVWIFGLKWFRLTVAYILPAVLFVWLFEEKKGLVSGLLTNRIAVWIGDLSPYAFLIHLPVIRWVGSWFQVKSMPVSLTFYIAFCYAVTLALSQACLMIRNGSTKRRDRRKATRTQEQEDTRLRDKKA